jgi:hypothetical protein
MDTTPRHVMSLARRAALAFAAIWIAGGLAGCASTRMEAQWRNPESSGVKYSGKVLVVGITRDDTMRRLYEDAMAEEMAARGITAVRSYEVLEGSLKDDSGAALAPVARRAGAVAVLSSALIAREHMHNVVVEPMPAWGWGYSGWYGHYWGFATRTEVRTYERFVVGTSLSDAATGKIIWTARTATDSNDRPEREVKAFAKTILSALVEAGLM